MLSKQTITDGDQELAPLSELFTALSDPARLRLLNLITQAEEVCSTDLEAVTDYGASKVSRHLSTLKRAGWVQDRRAGLWVFYSLRPSTGAVRAKLDRVLSVLPQFYGVLSDDAARLANLPHRGPEARPRAMPSGARPRSTSASPHDEPAQSRRHPVGSKKRVLFLCQSNAARSQMAEAFLRKYASDQFEVYSAGLTAGEVHPFTRQVMAEAGVDLSGQSAKGVDRFLGKKTFNYVVTLCLEAEEECPRMFPGAGKILQWPFEDVANAQLPEAEKLQRFRVIRDRIEQKIKAWLKD